MGTVCSFHQMEHFAVIGHIGCKDIARFCFNEHEINTPYRKLCEETTVIKLNPKSKELLS
jgi:hypothetical protein